MGTLIITADDYGYAPAYNEGTLEAAAAGAVDAVGAMVGRAACDPAPLLATGVEVGLHLELELDEQHPAARAGPVEREAAEAAIAVQFERFAALFGRPPAFLDGHRHAHARPGLGVVVADAALRAGIPVRSIDGRHRRLLRCRGVATNDLLLGRLDESGPALPAALGGDGPAPTGITEWMVHPGRPDASVGSRYDRGRGEDLTLLLGFTPPPGLVRATHAAALGAP